LKLDNVRGGVASYLLFLWFYIEQRKPLLSVSNEERRKKGEKEKDIPEES